MMMMDDRFSDKYFKNEIYVYFASRSFSVCVSSYIITKIASFWIFHITFSQYTVLQVWKNNCKVFAFLFSAGKVAYKVIGQRHYYVTKETTMYIGVGNITLNPAHSGHDTNISFVPLTKNFAHPWYTACTVNSARQ